MWSLNYEKYKKLFETIVISVNESFIQNSFTVNRMKLLKDRLKTRKNLTEIEIHLGMYLRKAEWHPAVTITSAKDLKS